LHGIDLQQQLPAAGLIFSRPMLFKCPKNAF
jgi:hypothetical protein